MGDHIVGSIVTVLTALIGVAIIAVIVSNNANTTNVISSAGNAFANDLSAALSPVTGGSGFTGGHGLNY